MRRKRKTAESGPRTAPCDVCGAAVPIPDDVPGGWRFSTDSWARCGLCRLATRAQLVAAMLTAVGIEADPDDAAVELALSRLPWQAAGHPAMSEPLISDFPGQPPARTPSGRTGSSLTGSLPLNSGNDRPWAHVDRHELGRAVEQARADITAANTPRPCTEGPCVGCGVAEAVQWLGYNLRTPTGRPMVVCGPCGAAWESSSESFEDWPAKLCAMALGVPPLMGLERFDFQPLYAVRDADPAGYPEPFGYVSQAALQAAQRRVWRAHPSTAPAEVRERMRRADAALARLTAARPSPAPPPLMVPGMTTTEAQP